MGLVGVHADVGFRAQLPPDSAIVVIFAGALTLTASLVQAYLAGEDRAIPNPAAIALPCLLAIGLRFILWKGQVVRDEAGSTAPLK